MGRSTHHPVGLIHNSEEAYKGYVLFSPLGSNYANLLNENGDVIHRWHCEEGIVYGKLLSNGNLLCRTKAPTDIPAVYRVGGSSSAIVELDPESNIVWRYDDPMLHHDFQRLENGNTLLLLFENLPHEVSIQVQGGHNQQDKTFDVGTSDYMLGDLIREITPDGETVKEWPISPALSYEEDVICDLENRREWTHGNSLNITDKGDFIVSFRSTSTIGILSKDSGKFLWKYGGGQLGHQHHPTFLDNGNILVFDNGAHTRGLDHSRVIEINPNNDEIVWTFEETPPIDFYSFFISSADRLPNGNTFICEGASGRFFEVTPKGDVVWEYMNPFTSVDLIFEHPNSIVYRAHKYGIDNPIFKKLDLDPDKYKDINNLYNKDNATRNTIFLP